MKCPDCGSEMVLRESSLFTTKSGVARKFWGCSHWPKCKGTHGAHPDGTPLGHPGDRETKDARMRLHARMEPLFRSRAGMYDWLREYAPKEHIGDMTLAEIEKTERTLTIQGL